MTPSESRGPWSGVQSRHWQSKQDNPDVKFHGRALEIYMSGFDNHESLLHQKKVTQLFVLAFGDKVWLLAWITSEGSSSKETQSINLIDLRYPINGFVKLSFQVQV
jgi:hypothetical protein